MSAHESYLSDILSGCCVPPDGMVCMLAAYLDDAGSEPSSPYVTMAGHVARRMHWEHFEKHSRRLFERYGVDVFHAMDLHNGRGAFKEWTRNRKLSFLREWATIAARKKVVGLTVTIPRQLYKDAQRTHRVNLNISPLHHCFIAAIKLILDDDELGPLVERHKIAFFVEDSDKLSGVEKWYRAQRSLPSAGGCLMALGLIPKHACYAIQYADALAFFSRRRAVRWDTHGESDPALEFMELLKAHRAILYCQTRQSLFESGTREQA